MTEVLSPQDRLDLDHVLSLGGEGEPISLDLSDERQHRFLMRQISGSGVDASRYPQLFRDLDSTVERHRASPPVAVALSPGLQDTNAITACGVDAASNAAAQAFSSVAGGTLSTQLFLQVFDVQSGATLASNLQTPVYGAGQYQPIQTSGQPAPAATRTVFTYSYTTGAGSVHQVLHYTTDERPSADPAVVEPTQKPEHGNNPYIEIALSRGAGNSADVDYWFGQTDWGSANVTVPMVGSVQFKSPIVQPLDPNTNFQAVLFVVKPASGGGQQVILPAHETLLNYMTIDPPDTLKWNMPSGPNRGDGGTPATFGNAPWSSDTIIYLHFQVAVKTQTSGQDFVFANVTSQDGADTDPLDGTTYIKPLQFIWHCLSAGTQILLADGTSTAVEDLIGGEEVQTNEHGETLPVRGTHVWVCERPLVSLTTSAGRGVRTTGEHPVMTPAGPRAAEDLKIGDVIRTIDGVETIAARSLDGGSEPVFNLVLDTEHLAAPTETTVIANGVVVGDLQIQTSHQVVLRSDPERVRAALPSEYHVDYASSLEDAVG